MTTKFSGLMARLETARARVKGLEESGVRANQQGSAENIKMFAVKYQMLNSWIEEHETVAKEIFSVGTKPADYLEADFRKQLMEFDDWIVNIRVIHDKLVGSSAVSSGARQDGPPVKLPAIQIPEFSGKISEWISFFSLYKSLILDHVGLGPVEKLQYLKSSVKGEAFDLIKSLDLTAGNLMVALGLLQDRYENTRKIATVHVDKIMGLPQAQTTSAKHIKDIVSAYREHVEALRVLKVIPDTFENTADGLFLFLILLRKLDPVTRANFERSLESSKEIPSPDRLIGFLEKECSALEASGGDPKEPNVRRSDGGRTNAFAARFAPRCDCCGKTTEHYLSQCPEFLSKSAVQRKQIVQQLGSCFLCFGAHLASGCSSRSRCDKCSGRHHRLLHFERMQSADNGRISSGMENSEGIHESETTTLSAQLNPVGTNVVLSTILIKVQRWDGRSETVRAMLDSGSQASYVTTHLAQRLKLNSRHSSMQVMGLSNNRVKSMGEVSLNFGQCNAGGRSFSLQALVLNNITGPLPSHALPSDIRRQMGNLQLADPQFDTPAPVECLLGAEVFAQVLTGGRMELSNGLVVLETTFGWILMGAVGREADSARQSLLVMCCHAVTDIDIDKTLQSFWATEELCGQQIVSEEDKRAERHFLETHSRDNDGRYRVQLPFREDSNELGESYSRAESRFLSLERRLQRNVELYDAYRKFMEEYIEMGHMEECRDFDRSLVFPHYYLPHHAVWKPSSSTTKVRVVFDASCKTASPSGVSLNDLLFSGPKLQQDITQVLLRFRIYPIAFAADIRQMFRCVWIRPEDQKFQLILWRSSREEPLKTYCLKTVTFGVTSSPYLAMRSVLQLVEDDGSAYPMATEVLRRDIFVDDIVSGVFTVEEGLLVQKQLTDLLQRGGFELRKWISNHAGMLEAVPESSREVPLSFSAPDQPAFGVLGVGWQARLDRFTYIVRESSPPATKRGVLSCVARIYDPTGFLSPVTFWVKAFLQSLWVAGVSWDEVLPNRLLSEWHAFLGDLPKLALFSLPRYLLSGEGELHGFSDASERGYAAVVYFCPSGAKELQPTILMAKSKVAPLKKVSLPRLELCGAHLLARLLNFCQSTLEGGIHIQDITAWTDSTVVLAWIGSPPHTLKTYVANRVAEIQDLVSPSKWRHVPSGENPADCASRGLYPSGLLEHQMWLAGPKFLVGPRERWPQMSGALLVDEVPEKKTDKCRTMVSVEPGERPVIQWDSYSSWPRIQRIMAYVIRFWNNCSSQIQRTGALSILEVRLATIAVFKLVQLECFGTDIAAIKQGQLCSVRVQRLSPFLDTAGLLRVGGRLQNADITYLSKHPIILPKGHHVTKLIIDHYHLAYLHAGPRVLQSLLFRQYWIVAGRSAIRGRILRCVTCFRHRPSNGPPVMADLPAFRVNQARAFLSVSLDYGGPFVARPHRRSKGRCKMYLCLFICVATKAVHLEVVSDLSTAAFLAALQRFVSRRGLCNHIYSDRGTNFVGAASELRKFQRFLNEAPQQAVLMDYALENGIAWHFQPPSAPHFGGLHEAAIKLAKFHIKRVIGSQILTYEELATLFARVEAVLNSRPLCPLSDDPAEVDVLTPGHFLVGAPLMALPQRRIDVTTSPRARWRLLQDLSHQFWRRWSREYLHTIIQKGKWFKDSENTRVGTLVLVQDENAPPQEWKRGRITAIHPGKDGIVRVVRVRTASGEMTRPAIKVFPLPLN